MSKICVSKFVNRDFNPGYGSYLFFRNGVFYFRIAVPNHLHSLLNRCELRKSLGTGRLKEARPLALRYAVLSREYFLLAEKILAGLIQLDTETLLQFTDFTDKNQNSIGTFWNLSQEEGFLDNLFLKHISNNNEDKTTKTVHLPHLSSSVIVNKNNVKQAYTKQNLEQIIIPTVPNNKSEKKRIIVNQNKEIQEVINKTIATKNLKMKEIEKETVPSLSKAVNDFIKAKSLVWTPGSAKEIPPHVKQFAEIIKELEGRDILISELGREHIRSYFNVLKYLPNRIIPKLHGGKKWKQLAEMGKQGKFERLLSSKTMQSRQINVRSFINWCELEYRGVVQARYINSGFQKLLADKQIVRHKSNREGFTQEELNKLFGNMVYYTKETEGSATRFWAPLIALYTGMRIEEICQLYIADIMQIDGVWCFSVNENTENKEHFKHVKSLAGIRYIPIHSYLWETVGLKNFVENRCRQIEKSQYQKVLLFPDMQKRLKIINGSTAKLSSPIVSWFIRYRRSVGVGGQEGELSNKTFHSFRHTVVEYLHKIARIDISMLQAVIGHEKNALGITDSYAGNWSMQVLLNEVISKLPWRF